MAQETKPGALPTNMHIQGTSYVSYSGNEKVWELFADKVEGTPQKTRASNIHGTLYKKGKPQYTLKSSLAYINTATSDINFPNAVLFRGSQGERIWVQDLSWEAQKKKFVGTKGVRLVHLNTRLRGDRMVWDKSFKEITLEGHVKAEIAP